ncbi:MAG TPA: ABC transporter permease [Polyangiaceae bacterium]|nr:ABC transporter permease [Polyangiaceae bacterium]
MLRLEARAAPARLFAYASPLIAIAATLVLCGLLFMALGHDPLRGLALFFVEPFRSVRALGELAIKATPLSLIGLGLALSFRANVWNIGAEGQFILGAVCAGRVALAAAEDTSRAIVVPILVAGALGGMAWASITAWLRDRFGTNEILVSLMLVYVAEQLLSYLVFGPWRDPAGHNFPQTSLFASPTAIPRLMAGSRANIGLLLALALVAAFWVFLQRSHRGYALEVGGLSRPAARHAGFSARASIWIACLVSGAMAGLAGALEVAGPVGQLTPHISMGYGFAAIIVAFVGRLSPVGVIFSSLLMSMFYIGGELAQSRLGLPKALTLVFQGLLLFALLASDTLIHSRVRWVPRQPATARPRAAASATAAGERAEPERSRG